MWPLLSDDMPNASRKAPKTKSAAPTKLVSTMNEYSRQPSVLPRISRERHEKSDRIGHQQTLLNQTRSSQSSGSETRSGGRAPSKDDGEPVGQRVEADTARDDVVARQQPHLDAQAISEGQERTLIDSVPRCDQLGDSRGRGWGWGDTQTHRDEHAGAERRRARQHVERRCSGQEQRTSKENQPT